ncbi:MAG: alpha/beta hydrolase [Proteobacteria bacterium]|nr:alpha/beta hydrolase [Desulfobacula sp.]MBU3950550.1 alpha/beta hydrolase [Pseudomonadota bacterium]MBU4133060.1 alpha/beta hydrolase [Pseudomonadota bacterium]
MEKAVTIHCNNIRLEGLLSQNISERGVVVTHPHPLYGGNMENPVVEQIVQSFLERGFTTLRFNFRGTGKSSGVFDNGVGEVEDVRAALDYLKGSKVTALYLAGYSFGARMNASLVSSGYAVQDHIMVSPPMGVLSFSDVASLPSTGLILTGANDAIAPKDMVQAAINRWKINPRFEVIRGCDHFYTGCLTSLKDSLLDYLT